MSQGARGDIGAVRPRSGMMLAAALVWVLVGLAPTSALAQGKGKEPAAAAPSPAPATSGDKPKGGKQKVFDFTGLDIGGRLRTPQLMYFLERANEELERASLERRSFIPEMVRTLDQEAL